MVEFALILPVLLLLIAGIIEGGLMFFGAATARFAAAEAATIDSEFGQTPDTSADDQAIATISRSALVKTHVVQIDSVRIVKVRQQPDNSFFICDVVAPVQCPWDDPNNPDKPYFNEWNSNLIANPAQSNWAPVSRNPSVESGDYLRVEIYYHYSWKLGVFNAFGDVMLKTDSTVRMEPGTYKPGE